MRFFMGLVLTLALGVMGCSETSGTGGTAGMGGGGVGGDGGYGGMGGEGGSGGSAVTGCTGVEDGTDCFGFELMGLCVAGSCEMLERCENDAFCRDYNDCRADTCLSNGLCEEGGTVQDGTPCAGGTCHGGECVLTTAVLPCTEQGVRNAIAAGGGPYTFACDGPTTVVTVAKIVVDNDVILDGESKLVLDGNEHHGVFLVAEGVTAELRGLTATRGVGGIGNSGTLTLTNCAVSGNTPFGQNIGGRGVVNSGTMTITDSTVSGNSARSRGGGIRNSSRGVLTLTNSIVSGNSANGGGGIFNERGTVTLTNSTVSGNTASGGDGGGGISSSGGTLTLTNCTVSANHAEGGGGIHSYDSTVTLTNTTLFGNHAEAGGAINNQGQDGGGALTLMNSTLSGNTATFGGGIFTTSSVTLGNSTVSGNAGAAILTCWAKVTLANSVLGGDCDIDSSCPGGDIVSAGYNIESEGDTCGFDQLTDQVDVSADDLKLGPLQDNGGPTETHALGAGSVAIDVIPAVDCVDADDQPLTTDQRGFPRDSMCDVGAFEVQP